MRGGAAMGWKIASAIWIAFVLAACAAQVPVPKLGALSEATRLSDREDEAFEALARFKGGGALKPPTPKTKAKMPRRGEMSSYGVTVSAALEEAFDAYIVGQTDRALAALNRAEVEAGADSRQLFEVSLLRAQVHIMTGRFDLAETDLARSAGFEQKVFGTNVNSRALRGEARFWAGDLDAAHADLARVAAATKAWRLPTAYGGPPTNLGELFNITNAQLRAYTVLAVIDLLREDFESALEWAERAEAGMVDVFYVSNHPLYGPFVPLHADAYYGRAINLAVLAAGRMVVGKDRVAAAAFFRSAHAYLDAIGFKTQKVTVDAIRAQALLAAGFDEDAAELGGSVVEQAASAGLVNILWRVEGIRGEAFLRAGRKSDAEAAFKRAQAAIDAVSGNLGTDKSKRRFGIGKEDITYRLAGLDIEKGDYLALFRDLERGRARAYVAYAFGMRRPQRPPVVWRTNPG